MRGRAVCKICASMAQERFRATVLGRHHVAYYCCESCGFMQTEEPYWLPEAYSNSITASDTGSLLRSLFLAELASVILYCFYDRDAKYLDFAGGYGLFARRMRDIGFDFYWRDAYSPNLVARGFEYAEELGRIELITSFESFEHFSEPIAEIERMLAISRNIIFTTELLPDPIPTPEQWYYYGLHHGQHISFYSERTMRYIADKYNLRYCSSNSLHFLSDKPLAPTTLSFLTSLRRFGLFLYVKRRMTSRTVLDSVELTNRAMDTHRQSAEDPEVRVDKSHS